MLTFKAVHRAGDFSLVSSVPVRDFPPVSASMDSQVVLMRASIKQAKVHIIRKLSRKAIQLRKKKGSEDQLVKNLAKANRLVDEIRILKTVDCDEVAKFALNNKRKFAEIVKKAKPDSELRAMSRLADHSATCRAVISFREKYPNWETEIPTHLQMWEIRKKFKRQEMSGHEQFRNKPRISSLKERLATMSKTEDDMAGDHDEAATCINCEDDPEEMSDVEMSNQDFLTEDVPKLPILDCASNVKKPTKKSKLVKEMQPSSTLAKTKKEAESELPTSDCTVNVKKPANKSTSPPSTLENRKHLQQSIREKTEGEITVKRINLLLDDDDGEIQLTSPETDCLGSKPAADDLTVRDSSKCKKDKFFLGASSDSDDDDSDTDNKHSDNELLLDDPIKPRFQKNLVYHQRRLKSRVDRKDTVPPKFKPDNKFGSKLHSTDHVMQSKSRFQNNETNSMPQYRADAYVSHQDNRHRPIGGDQAGEAALHPSWEAKKKIRMQQSQIMVYQGTKIKFDD